MAGIESDAWLLMNSHDRSLILIVSVRAPVSARESIHKSANLKEKNTEQA
jgi:hypothetical protein